ncbi:MAG: hypothetical protein H6942_04295 [Candidatus Accumulibacter sp.]|uniref:hypothetical protein n=1 Tax=Accumulibacter sp. TaxID=2053492 RepID=UPI0025F32EB4|nr:hypothetical protein [Accumulibacter sp.]MCP5247753.1 hypothetical protein [Accumulibacter sp.]
MNQSLEHLRQRAIKRATARSERSTKVGRNRSAGAANGADPAITRSEQCARKEDQTDASDKSNVPLASLNAAAESTVADSSSPSNRSLKWKPGWLP